ncbi:MAG: TolC family outer membrane protein [Magnetococcales bacterium]|nr:TolC family outer membrane protein [Magnetococcales bacterium]
MHTKTGWSGTRVLRCSVLAGLMFLLPVQPARGITLSESVHHAMDNNPEVLAARDNLQAVLATLPKAKAGYYPSIDLSGTYGRETSDNPTTRAVNNPGDHNLTLSRGETGVTITQPVFDALRTRYNLGQAEANIESAEQSLSNVEETIGITVVETYLEVLRLQQLLELDKDYVLLHQRVKKVVEEKAEAGGGSVADVEQTESRLALAMANMAANQGQYDTTVARFLRVVNRKPDRLTMPAMPKGVPETLQAAIEAALVDHPSVLMAKADVVSAEASKDLTKSNFLPSVDLKLNMANNANVNGVVGHDNSVSALVTMNYNLYRGGRDRAERDEMSKRLGQRREILDNTRLMARERIERAWAGLQSSEPRVRHLKKHVEVTASVTQAYHNQFQMGKRTWLDVLNSENALYVARKDWQAEEFKRILSAYQLLNGMGRLRDAMGGQSKPATK